MLPLGHSNKDNIRVPNVVPQQKFPDKDERESDGVTANTSLHSAASKHTTNSGKAKSVRLAIDIGNGKVEALDFEPSEDDALKVATTFCEKNSLPDDAKQVLADQLVDMSKVQDVIDDTEEYTAQEWETSVKQTPRTGECSAFKTRPDEQKCTKGMQRSEKLYSMAQVKQQQAQQARKKKQLAKELDERENRLTRDRQRMR